MYGGFKQMKFVPLSRLPQRQPSFGSQTDLKQVQSSALQEQYMQLLPPVEQDYVSQGANAEIRKERLLARTLVRVILAR